MKKIYLILCILFFNFFVACNNDEEKIPDAPTLLITGIKSDGSVDLQDPMTFKCVVNAPGYIKSIACTIESPTIPEYLKTKGIDPAYFDLADPNIAQNEKDLLTENGIKCGDEVYMQTQYSIDLSTVLPKLFLIEDGNFDHTFKVVIKDFYERYIMVDIVVHQYKQTTYSVSEQQ